MDLPILGRPGRISVEDERYLSKSWASGSMEVELQIFGSQGRAEVWKRNFTSLEVPAEIKSGSGLPYLEVLAEQERKMNEIFRSPAERKYGKRNFRSLVVKTERNCGCDGSDL